MPHGCLNTGLGVIIHMMWSRRFGFDHEDDTMTCWLTVSPWIVLLLEVGDGIRGRQPVYRALNLGIRNRESELGLASYFLFSEGVDVRRMKCWESRTRCSLVWVQVSAAPATTGPESSRSDHVNLKCPSRHDHYMNMVWWCDYLELIRPPHSNLLMGTCPVAPRRHAKSTMRY